MARLAALCLAVAGIAGWSMGFPPPPPRIAVLSVDLNNLTNSAPDSSLPSTMRGLGTALQVRLAEACGYAVVRIDSLVEDKEHATNGYFYDHPDIAAGVAGRAGADWVVVPRINRASPWVTDLQAHLVRVRDSVLVSNRIVELKGLELDPELARRLIDRGAAWMADQISQALEHATAPDSATPRRCPA